MNISIFGLGYVGCVGAACFAKSGHKIVGVDINENKVKLINSGKSPVVEKDLPELMEEVYKKGLIEGTQDSYYAVKNTDVSFITVGTPNNENGHLNMKYIYNVAEEIGKVLKDKHSFHIIVLRSTVEPGTNKKIIEIIEKISGKENKKDFGVVSNPEFLREGTAIYDFFNPPYTLVASESEKAIKIMKELYKEVNAEFYVSDIGTAEIIKFVNNSYHALKVAFANEIGRVCKKLNIDSFQVMDMFCKDTKLNISPYYFKPGFAYGGSCLPKDLSALNLLGHDNYVNIPILNSVKNSNDTHIEHAYNLILNKKKNNIGFLGLSFKKGTDDIRFSPSLIIVEKLLGKGFNVNIYDKNINLMQLMGKNKEMLYSTIPHIMDIMNENIDNVINESDIIVISYKDSEFEEYIKNNKNKFENKIIIDFAGISLKDELKNYEGICW